VTGDCKNSGQRVGTTKRSLADLNCVTKWKLNMDMRIAKVRAEMREHPERFDFGDLPPAELTQTQKESADRMRPDWLKEPIAKTGQS